MELNSSYGRVQMCFHAVAGVWVLVLKPETYQIRIGTFMTKYTLVCKTMAMEIQIWFLGLVLMVLLMTRGVQLNLEPPVNQGKTDRIKSL